ncbi:auxin-responsive protein SAUR71-like [Silene latifolia]|uniref:auxin-responsive protein SAUR71-like n=1 Tax=Silene latifolia TaxID=37657 RepID=UPI003D77F5C7
MKLKRFIVKLRRCMQFIQPVNPIASDDDRDEGSSRASVMVPEGHFTVIAGNGERFVVELRHLRNPAVLKLLKEAEEEYGFQQEGALSVPCTPLQLQTILSQNM